MSIAPEGLSPLYHDVSSDHAVTEHVEHSTINHDERSKVAMQTPSMSASLTRLGDCSMRPPVAIDRGSTLEMVARRLYESNVSSLLVGESGALVSIVTERDLVDAIARGLPVDTPVDVVAVPNPLTVSVDDSLWQAGVCMIENGVRHLVVTSNNQAVGVVSMRDVVCSLIATATSEATDEILLRTVVERPEFWLG